MVYYNLPPKVVQETANLEVNFMSEDLENELKEKMRPEKTSSIPLDKQIIGFKQSRLEKQSEGNHPTTTTIINIAYL